MQRPQWRDPFFFVHTHLIFACWDFELFFSPIKDSRRSWGDHCLSLLCRSRVAVVGTPARVNAPSAHCGHAMMLGQCYTLLQRNPEQLSCIGAVLKPSQHWEQQIVHSLHRIHTSSNSRCVCSSKLPILCSLMFLPRKTSKYTWFLSEQNVANYEAKRRPIPVRTARKGGAAWQTISANFWSFPLRGSNLETEWYPKEENKKERRERSPSGMIK